MSIQTRRKDSPPAVVRNPSATEGVRQLATRVAPRVPGALHAVNLVVAFVVLMVVDRHMWFRVDDFDFLTRRGLHGANLSLWAPHNDHWSTLPILVYRALFSLYGMRTAQPYLVVAFILHLTLAHVLWRAMRRARVQPYLATALVAVFTLLGAGAADILWSFQIGYVGSLLLGWVFVLLVDHGEPFSRRDVLAVLVGILALMTSSVAVVMAMVAGLVVLARRGLRAAVFTVAPVALVYLVYYVTVAQATWVPGHPFKQVMLFLPGLVFTGFTNAVSQSVGSSALGPVLAAALGYWAIRRSGLARTRLAAPLMGLAGSLLFLAVSAFGPDAGTATSDNNSRFVYAIVALLLPAAGAALSSLAERRPGRVVALVCLIALAGVANFGLLLQTRDALTAQSLATKRQFVAAARIAATEPTVPGSLPLANVDAPDLFLRMLPVLTRNHDLPTGVVPGLGSKLNAAVEMQVGVTTGALFSPLQACAGTTVRQGPGGSVALTVQPGAPVSIRVSAPSAGQATAALSVGSRSSVTRVLDAPAGGYFVDDAASHHVLQVTLPAGAQVAGCPAGG